jgi:hypothetical protein
MHPYRTCDKCSKIRPPEGGCQMGPVRWICGACWKSLQLLGTRKPNASLGTGVVGGRLESTTGPALLEISDI